MLSRSGSLRNFWALFFVIAQLIVMLAVLQSTSAFSAQRAGNGYFYQQETLQKTPGKSCSEIFAEIHRGQGEDVGGVVKSLNALNVQYLLEDYDDALSRDPRKKGYVELDDLLREVGRNKRDIYCKIEMAIYLQSHEEFAGPAYDALLSKAFEKLEETYTSAKASLDRGELQRALYAFDLIAPYKDSNRLYQDLSGALQKEEVEEEIVVAAEEDVSEQAGGAIALSLQVDVKQKGELRSKEPGAIALAARLGPISSAVQMTKQE